MCLVETRFELGQTQFDGQQRCFWLKFSHKGRKIRFIDEATSRCYCVVRESI